MSFFVNKIKNSNTVKALTIFHNNPELVSYYDLLNFVYPLDRAHGDIEFQKNYTYYNEQCKKDERFKKAYEGYKELPREYHYHEMMWKGYPSYIVGAYLLNANKMPNESSFDAIWKNVKFNY